MLTFADIKILVRNDRNVIYRYSRFQDLLIENDNRGKDPAWDLWYFYHNTNFCLQSSEYYHSELQDQANGYRNVKRDSDKKTGFTFDDSRRIFGAFIMYLYAALDSFAHEVNLFYELNLPRQRVSFLKMKSSLRQNSVLRDHLRTIELDADTPGTDLNFLFEYRNTVAHGYVYPLSGRGNGIFLARQPRAPTFIFDTLGHELFSFSDRIMELIPQLIRDGWICFSNDELMPPEAENSA